MGIAYQPGGSSGYDPSSGKDPLSDGDTCLRDAALMQRLGAYSLGYGGVEGAGKEKRHREKGARWWDELG